MPMPMPCLRVLALSTLALLTACAGDDGDSMGSDTTSGGTTTPTATSEASDTATTSGDDTDASTTATSTMTTTDDTTTTTSTSDPTTTGTETTGVDTDTTTTTTTTTDSTTDPTGGGDQLPPIDSVDALLAWLEAGNYMSWQAESGIHPSSGPHGGQVRTFFNDVLFDSFTQGLTAHPQGAVAVKELWGDGQSIIGWAVEVKVDADSQGGDGWYWYEKIGMTEYGGGTGISLCYGCHGGGGVDYVLTPWPLQ